MHSWMRCVLASFCAVCLPLNAVPLALRVVLTPFDDALARLLIRSLSIVSNVSVNCRSALLAK